MGKVGWQGRIQRSKIAERAGRRRVLTDLRVVAKVGDGAQAAEVDDEAEVAAKPKLKYCWFRR